MIKLSDYLDYLYNEIIQARKKADEKTVLVAKEYARHEYLKYFKAPRYAFPSVKMDIPLKITDISSLSKYNFDQNKDKFLKEVNEKIQSVNREKHLNIKSITNDELQNESFSQLFKTLESKDRKPVRNLEDEIIKIDVLPQIESLRSGTLKSKYSRSETETIEMKRIFSEVISNSYSLVSTKLNDIFIDPNTSGAVDKDKLFINLHIEMEEEGIRLVTFTDKDGKTVEEIIFE
ncbi:MAG: hypothetical protein EOM44_13465 [Bacteroidia bacterium]|nr:hypothetical protein [Bacteroidia bacterium]